MQQAQEFQNLLTEHMIRSKKRYVFNSALASCVLSTLLSPFMYASILWQLQVDEIWREMSSYKLDDRVRGTRVGLETQKLLKDPVVLPYKPPSMKSYGEIWKLIG